MKSGGSFVSISEKHGYPASNDAHFCNKSELAKAVDISLKELSTPKK